MVTFWRLPSQEDDCSVGSPLDELLHTWTPAGSPLPVSRVRNHVVGVRLGYLITSQNSALFCTVLPYPKGSFSFSISFKEIIPYQSH